jgi:hypothetical protein
MRDLEKKNDDDSNGDEDGEDKPFRQSPPGVLKRPFPNIREFVILLTSA